MLKTAGNRDRLAGFLLAVELNGHGQREGCADTDESLGIHESEPCNHAAGARVRTSSPGIPQRLR
jgi:hypothetical protein